MPSMCPFCINYLKPASITLKALLNRDGKSPSRADITYPNEPSKETAMDLQSRLTEDMKTAMKSGQKDRLMVIRMLLSDVKNIDLMPNKPTAEQVVAAYGKKLHKTVEEYEKLGKPEEVAKLKSE